MTRARIRSLPAIFALLFAMPVGAQDAIRVGSKSFTENCILGEIVAQVTTLGRSRNQWHDITL